MSRTDKTKPYWVRVAEHNPRPVHNHTRGECTLPESPYEKDRDWGGCYWELFSTQFTCCSGCGCDLCTDRPGRRAARRRERHETKVLLAAGEQERERRPKVSRKRKDTARWCRGKVGREHVPQVRQAQWASWLWSKGKTCYRHENSTWLDREQHWVCYHELACESCGKILQHHLPYWSCPLFTRPCKDLAPTS